MIEVALKVRIAFSCTRTDILTMIKTILALTTCWSTKDLPHSPTVLIDSHSQILKATSSSSFQRLCPRVIFLASLFLWRHERTGCTLCVSQANFEPFISGFAVMLAETLYDGVTGVADEAWGEITALPVDHMLSYRNEFLDILTEDLPDGIESKLWFRLCQFFDRHNSL
jgi:hypothetical protein